MVSVVFIGGLLYIFQSIIYNFFNQQMRQKRKQNMLEKKDGAKELEYENKMKRNQN